MAGQNGREDGGAASAKPLTRINDIIAAVIGGACAVLLALMIVTVFVQVVARYVFHVATPWAEEVAIYCLVWTVFLGMSGAIRSRRHLIADFLPPTLSEAKQNSINKFSDVVVFLLAIYFLIYGIKYSVIGITRYSMSMGFPMFYVYLALPISGAVSISFITEVFGKEYNSEK